MHSLQGFDRSEQCCVPPELPRAFGQLDEDTYSLCLAAMGAAHKFSNFFRGSLLKICGINLGRVVAT
jgi:hypothetical protein